MSKSEISTLTDDTLVSFVDMPSVSEHGFIAHQQYKPLSEVRTGSYTYFAEGDIIIAKITPCMENGKCAIARGLEQGVGFGSSEFHTFRCKGDIRTEYLFGYLNRQAIRDRAAAAMTGSSGHRRVPIEFYQDLMIPLPTLTEQDTIISIATSLRNRMEQAEQRMTELQVKKDEFIRQMLM